MGGLVDGKTIKQTDIQMDQGLINRLPRHPGQVYFHAGLMLIADDLPIWASGF